jgi:ATP/maltotriose-dependent transcriptional regulator MalT
VRSRLRLAEGDLREAQAHLDRAEAELIERQQAPLVAMVHRQRAALLVASGRHDEAHALLLQTRDEYAYLGCAREIAAIDRQLAGAGPVSAVDAGGRTGGAPASGAPDPRAWGLGAWDPDSG